MNKFHHVCLLYQFKFSQLVYSLQPLKVLPSFAYHLGRPYGRWAMLPSIPQWTFPHLAESHMNHLNTRTNLDVYPFLLGMSIASLCCPPGSNSAWQWSQKLLLILLRIVPLTVLIFNWKQQLFEILINDKFPPELPSLAAQNETQVTSNEMWVWQHQTVSTYLMRTYFLSIFNNWDV